MNAATRSSITMHAAYLRNLFALNPTIELHGETIGECSDDAVSAILDLAGVTTREGPKWEAAMDAYNAWEENDEPAERLAERLADI